MNLLAHAYLSFNEPGILVGNMTSDYIKGKKKYDYPGRIQQGIALHREIDAFTDAHPVTAAVKQFFKQDYGLYAAPLADIVYDHFLANDTSIFVSEDELKQFTTQTYSLLDQHEGWFPHTFRQMFPYMQQQDWLFNYRFNHGIEKSFAGLAHRAKYMRDTTRAMEIFIANKPALDAYYRQFFPVLKNHALSFLGNLKNG